MFFRNLLNDFKLVKNVAVPSALNSIFCVYLLSNNSLVC